MKIVVFNARFSANVGDGLIAECLQRQLELTPGVDGVKTLDLGGKETGSLRADRRLASQAFMTATKLPHWVGRPLALAMNIYATAHLVRRWTAALKDADAVLIGGGQLLVDVGYYFPVRLAMVLFLSKQKGLPVALHALGMSPMSWGARILLRSALRAVDLRSATFRDATSRNLFNQMMRGGYATLTPDPALMTERHVKPAAAPLIAARSAGPGRRVVGLGIIEPAKVNEKLSDDPAVPSLTGEVFLEIARCLTAKYELHVFCNGLYEDAAVLSRLQPALVAAGAHVHDPPSSPADLVAIIATCDCVVAHRLHAAIAAYSLKKPVVALQWCPKVESFCGSAERGVSFLRASDLSGPAVSAAVERALADEVDPQVLERQIDLAAQGIEDAVRMVSREGHATAEQFQAHLDSSRTQR